MNIISDLYESISLENLGFQDGEKCSASPLTKLEGLAWQRGDYI